MSNVQFGLRLAEFPLDGTRGEGFTAPMFDFIDATHAHFASAWIADHFFPWMDKLDQRIDTLEALSSIAYLMGRYRDLRFGSIVLSQGYRSPALLAKMGATLHMLSGGKFILGLGAGWKENEYKAYGYDYPATGVRLNQLAEAVQVIRAMWYDENPTFHGKYYHIENAYCAPRFNPPPPIMIGGGGRQKTLRIVAQYADWWNVPGTPVEEYRDMLNTLRQHCQEVGRDYDSITKTWMSDCLSIAPSHAEAERIAHASPLCAPSSIIGTPDEVAAGIQRYVDMGVTHIMLRFADFPHSTAGALLFAKEVMPRFA